MKKNHLIVIVSLWLGLLSLACKTSAQNAPQLRVDNVDEVLKAMTLEEKVRLIVGGGQKNIFGGSLKGECQKEIVAGALGMTCAIPRLGIPATVMTDGPAGVRIDVTREGSTRKYTVTGFPVGTCLASSWDTELVEEVGRAIGEEALDFGIDMILGPGMNLQRNPLGGRNYEYYSEDPLLTGGIASAYIKGVQSNGVGACAKHFAVNSQETNRYMVDERVSPRALRELYLRSFEKVVREAKPMALMSAYNFINSHPAMGYKDLLDDVLRKDWGYEGFVMTDWAYYNEITNKDYVKAGSDLLMPGMVVQMNNILELVKNGKISTEVIDRNVRRVLQYIVKTPRFKGYVYSDKPDFEAHAKITRKSGADGMVLLKNNASTLPFKNVKKVALFGVNSYDFLTCGLGSGYVNSSYTINIEDGLKNAGVACTQTISEIYRNYVKFARPKLLVDKDPALWYLDLGCPKLEEFEVSERCINHELAEADVAIITIGRQSGEETDRAIEGDFTLTHTEKT